MRVPVTRTDLSDGNPVEPRPTLHLLIQVVSRAVGTVGVAVSVHAVLGDYITLQEIEQILENLRRVRSHSM